MPRAAGLIVVLVLLVGTTAAFVVSERLKLERLPVTTAGFEEAFSPVCDCPREQARMEIRLRRADRVTAWIVDSSGTAVRTLARDRRLRRGLTSLEWDGRADDGSVAPDGRYQLRVRLEGADRTILLPSRVVLDTKAPQAEILGVAPLELSPDGDGRADAVRIVYRSSEAGRPLVYVSGQGLPETKAKRGGTRPAGTARVFWPGTVARRPLPAGTYTLTLRVRDRAGNVSEPTRSVTIRLVR